MRHKRACRERRAILSGAGAFPFFFLLPCLPPPLSLSIAKDSVGHTGILRLAYTGGRLRYARGKAAMENERFPSRVVYTFSVLPRLVFFVFCFRNNYFYCAGDVS